MEQEFFDMVKEKLKYSSSHGWDHTLRVYKLCMRLADSHQIDREILGAAALLHDIARHVEDNSKGKICHAKEGALMARDILEKEGWEEPRISRVMECILSHRYRNEDIAQSMEAKILFDADKLDSIGAVGIGRAFLFSGEIGARLHDIDYKKGEQYSREDTAYREFMVKLRKVKGCLLTEEGRRLARKRHEFMVDFFERLNDEVEGRD